MFPYQGTLANISALNAYTLEDIKIIQEYAKKSNLSVIPLIQTFGHLEFLLKLKEFEYLREVPEYPQVICPSHEKTLLIIVEMLNQVIKAHPGITKLHIGADEVWFIGICNKCITTLNKHGWTKTNLFLEYVTSVVQKIHKLYPHIRILMWDDEFRSMSENELQESKISTLIEPVIWKYDKNVLDELGPALWDMYSAVFSKVWIASAFKGATGSNKYITDIAHHLQNHRSWLNVVSKYKNKLKFEGIFLTGWQRYDHFAILCELLPVAIPSLAINLHLLLGFNEPLLKSPIEIATILQCEQAYTLIASTFELPKCFYPGADVLEIVLKFHHLKKEYLAMLEDSRIKGWMTDYNVKHEFSNPYYVETGTAALYNLKLELEQLQSDFFFAMQEVYDNYTIEEWSSTFIKPFMLDVQTLWSAKQKLLPKSHWPRRPLVDNHKNEL